MKAIVKKYKKKGLWLEDIPVPSITENDCLIKIEQTSICGTDVHIYQWDEWAQKTIPVPMQIGHEFVGRIAKIGKAVKHLKIGELVSGEGHIFCRFCRNCRAGVRHLCVNTRGIGVNIPGCFAEYLSLPASNIFPIPDGVSVDEASILDPLGNAVHTALSFDLVGEDVLITGAGPIGIMAGVVCEHVGARHVVITDINPYRLKLAKSLGIKNAIDVSKSSLKDVMKKLKMKEGFDVGLEMSGSPIAFNDMLKTIKMGGKIAMLGFLPADTTIEWNKVIMKGLILKGVYGREIYETWYKMTAMLQSGLNIDAIFTHRFPVDEYEKGFEIMSAGKAGKVILEWGKGK